MGWWCLPLIRLSCDDFENICIIIIKSEIWIISHYLGLGHGSVVRVVCLAILMGENYRNQRNFDQHMHHMRGDVDLPIQCMVHFMNLYIRLYESMTKHVIETYNELIAMKIQWMSHSRTKYGLQKPNKMYCRHPNCLIHKPRIYRNVLEHCRYASVLNFTTLLSTKHAMSYLIIIIVMIRS